MQPSPAGIRRQYADEHRGGDPESKRCHRHKRPGNSACAARHPDRIAMALGRNEKGHYSRCQRPGDHVGDESRQQKSDQERVTLAHASGIG
jgi:hypothetical protein